MFCLRSWTLRPPVFKLFGLCLRSTSNITPDNFTRNEARGIDEVVNKSLLDGPKAEPKASQQIEDKNKAPVSTVRIDAAPGIKPVKEIRIPVPWGHIAGKWWGPTHTQPIIGLHGWQDNAGTWDRLALYLPRDVGLLSIDLPGHGLSSHFPPGQGYHFLEYVAFVRRVTDFYGWQSVSFLSHSLGSMVAFTYSCLYPDSVHNYIAIDAMKPFSFKAETCVKNWGKFIDKLIRTDRYSESDVPTYTYAEAVDRMMAGSNGWLTRESCDYLLERGMETTDKGRYKFTRDPRVKIGQLQMVSLNKTMKSVLASAIQCHVCNITASKGFVYDTVESTNQTYELVRRSAKTFENHVVEGTHQVHLNNPERVAPIINNFLNARKSED